MKAQHLLASVAALCALATTAAQSAVVSINYAAENNTYSPSSVNGTITWDTDALAVDSGVHGIGYQPVSVTLIAGGLDISGALSGARLWVGGEVGVQYFLLTADIGTGSPWPSTSLLSINFVDTDMTMFAVPGQLPTSAAVANAADLLFVSAFGNPAPGDYVNVLYQAELVPPSTTAPPTPSGVPEPASMLLVALAGLALGATRRRSATI